MLSIDVSFEAEPPVHKSYARPTTEALGRTLERMRMLLAPKRNVTGKKTSRNDVLQGVPSARVLRSDGSEVDESVLNADAWCDAKVLQLGPHQLAVLYNVPTVTSLAAPSKVIVGVPTLCTNMRLMFSHGEQLVCEWRALDSNQASPEQRGDAASCGPVVGTEFVLVPGSQLVGKQLLFRCRPDVAGSVWTEVITPAVEAAANHAYEPMARWVHTQERVRPPSFRVVTYNILHEGYCTSKFAMAQLYPFCSSAVLDITYRRAREIQELQAYNPDVCCLQECGRDVYEKYFRGVFRSLGWQSTFALKRGDAREGLCIVWRESRFSLLSQLEVSLTAAELREHHPELAAKVALHSHLDDAMTRLPTVAVLVALEDLSTHRILIVFNTHLFYHPDGCHIRALQMYMALHALCRFKSQVMREHPQKVVDVVMCGDYNFTRITGGYRLVTTGKVESDNSCWCKGLRFWWGVDKGIGVNAESAAEDEGNGAKAAAPTGDAERPTSFFADTLTSPLGCGLQDAHIHDSAMRWTNYTLQFKEIIDHIFHTDTLRCLRTVPLPAESDLTRDIAIPSMLFPSDHLALIADFAASDLVDSTK